MKKYIKYIILCLIILTYSLPASANNVWEIVARGLAALEKAKTYTDRMATVVVVVESDYDFASRAQCQIQVQGGITIARGNVQLDRCLGNCGGNNHFAYFAWHGELSHKLDQLYVSCQAQGRSQAATQLKLSYPYIPFFPKHRVFLGSVWEEAKSSGMVRSVQSSPSRVSYQLEVPPPEFYQINRSEWKMQTPPGAFLLRGPDAVGKADIPYFSSVLAVPVGLNPKDIIVRVQPFGAKNHPNRPLSLVPKPTTDQGITVSPVTTPILNPVISPIFNPGSLATNVSIDRNSEFVSVAKDYSYEVLRDKGLNLVLLRFPLIDYNSGSVTVTSYSHIQVSIDFARESSCYMQQDSSADLSTTWLAPGSAYRPFVLNSKALSDYTCEARPIPGFPPIFLQPTPVLLSSGLASLHSTSLRAACKQPSSKEADILLVYNDQDFAMADAVHRFRMEKHKRGYRTYLLGTSEVGDMSHPLAAHDLRDAIHCVSSKFTQPPNWLILVGNTAQVPTLYLDEKLSYLDLSVIDPRRRRSFLLNSTDRVPNAGDVLYGYKHNNVFESPDMRVGRLPVATARELVSLTRKIASYEQYPSHRPQFSSTWTLTGYFKDESPTNDRSDDYIYAEVLERSVVPLIGNQRQLNRIYQASPGSRPRQWSDGSFLNGDLSSLYWQSEFSDLARAVDRGSSLVVNRGHGSIDRWQSPSLETYRLNELRTQASEQPFYLGINCLSGLFDHDQILGLNDFSGLLDQGFKPSNPSLAQELLLSPQGAIAYLGSSRTSPTYQNDRLTVGLFHALSQSDGDLRFGSVLASGKAYLSSLFPEVRHDPNSLGSWDLQLMSWIYNLLGDPTVRLSQSQAMKIKVLHEKLDISARGQFRLDVGIELVLPSCEDCLVSPEIQAELMRSQQVLLTILDENGQLVARRAFDSSAKAQILVNLPSSDSAENLSWFITGNDVIAYQSAK